MVVASRPRRFRNALIELAQLDKSDLDLALRRIIEVDAATLEVERVSYWELAPDHSRITCQVLLQRARNQVTSGAVLAATDYPRYFEALLSRRAIVADDAASHPQTSEFASSYFPSLGITSMLDIPVWRGGRLAGVVCHEHVGPARTWTADEQDFALAIGNLISVALETGDRRRAEERYALLAQATNEVFYDWDVRNDVAELSELVSTAFAIPPEEVGTTGSWWLSRIVPEDRERIAAELQRVLDDPDGRSWTARYRFLRGDGSTSIVHDRGFVARDADGQAVRMVGTMLDVTDQVTLEARLAVSERMATVGTLAAGVAHEINNPLTYILNNLSFALEDLSSGAGPTSDTLEMLREAYEGAERVRDIVRDLKSLSRPHNEDFDRVDVRTVIDSTVKVVWNEIRHRARFEKDYGDVPLVRANHARLGQVILNLLVNAAHAIPEGHAEHNLIRVVASTDDLGRAVVEVHDTGVGITSDMRKRIFDPFFTTKPVGTGTGLGLSICHSIVTGYGGDIEVESAPGRGCVMRVRLPPAPAAPTATPLAVPAPGRLRILIVDDEPGVRGTFMRMLGTQHEVLAVDSGQAALELLRRGKPIDIILCDLLMPHMTGMDLHERLVAEAPALAQRMIFMTAGAFSQRAMDFIAGGQRLVLDKPTDASALARAIATVLAVPAAG